MKYQELMNIVDAENTNSTNIYNDSNSSNGPDTTPDIGFPVLKRLSPAIQTRMSLFTTKSMVKKGF
jgi:hypothetical protein